MPPPPDEFKTIESAETKTWTTDTGEHAEYQKLTMTVEDDYEVVAAKVDYEYKYFGNASDVFVWAQDPGDLIGRSGEVFVIYGTRHVRTLYLQLKLNLKLRDVVFSEWQMKAWSALRDAAQASYAENRQTMKDRYDRLAGEVGAQDALTLRKLEREEIMKGVLRWLFGPSFQFLPADIPAAVYGPNGGIESEAIFARVSAYGEIIKFLHQAIEWENMVYMLYPYFWSHPTRWELKKYLDHPDLTHAAFLKAGSARVVLTIRPGFEGDFVAFVETGGFDPLPPDHPYLRIAQEVEDYAKTNYPGIPPNDAEHADTNDQGIPIGTWFEYTPTSALDIAFNETMPSA